MRPTLWISLRFVSVRAGYFALSFCLLFSVICLLERPAHAYVDPGSGLLAFQSVSALITGCLFYCRKKIRRLLMSCPPEEVSQDFASSKADPE